jgi:hypothetical protein
VSVDRMDQERQTCWKRDELMTTTGEQSMARKASGPESVVVRSQLYVHGAPGCAHNETYGTTVGSLGYRLSGGGASLGTTVTEASVTECTSRARDLGTRRRPKNIQKAYDRIRHDYLWETLERFKIPNTFINTVKELYRHAHTRVAINGILSSPFKVTRGVRQGDPLSCALFNLAIEPLACRVRKDGNIRGLEIPGIEEIIIISLYADDTNLFLNKEDSLEHVQTTLDESQRQERSLT